VLQRFHPDSVVLNDWIRGLFPEDWHDQNRKAFRFQRFRRLARMLVLFGFGDHG
ncbi:hypothetical protein Pmar_PMAR024368, partial [Perkinsus marinus ATCC 50983]